MDKSRHSIGRIASMVIFALSCFGLLLFLWLSFGGPIPLKPKGYRIQVAFPEASQLATQADVRVSGVSVGHVVHIRRDPRGDRELATLELDASAAPLPADTRAVLRSKTLLGETYIEMTPGSRSGPFVPENGRLADAQVQHTVEFDEILNTFGPRTRHSFRVWQQETGEALSGRGADLNGAIANLPGFFESGGDLLSTLDTEKGALSRLIRNTGVVFSALARNQSQLQRLVTATDEVFATTAQRNRALSETFAILPTFERESRALFRRTQSFAEHTRATVRLLRPPTRDLAPTIRDLAAAAPDLRGVFRGIIALEPVSRTGLPATGQILRGVRPVLEQLGLVLAQANPFFEYLEANQYQFGDWFSQGAGALAATEPTQTKGSAGHYLRQFGANGVESVGIYRQRLATDRGNTYFKGTDLADPRLEQFGILPNFDCANAGGERRRTEGPGGAPACFVVHPGTFQGLTSAFPKVQPDDYSHPRKTRRVSP